VTVRGSCCCRPSANTTQRRESSASGQKEARAHAPVRGPWPPAHNLSPHKHLRDPKPQVNGPRATPCGPSAVAAGAPWAAERDSGPLGPRPAAPCDCEKRCVRRLSRGPHLGRPPPPSGPRRAVLTLYSESRAFSNLSLISGGLCCIRAKGTGA
jgi:hypothetical protein